MRAHRFKPVQHVTLIFVFIVFCTCRHTLTKETDGFVRVEGRHFMIGGDKYYFAGVNYWQGAYLGANIIEGGRERICRELDLMLNHGITNLRVMASSEHSSLSCSVKPCFRDSAGNINSDLLIGLDYLLDEMGKRGMKAVLVLNNYWQWTGGMVQYINRHTGDSIIDPDITGNWHGFMSQSATFYGNNEAVNDFLNYIRQIILRRNSINKTPYHKDPVIMSWQLANEPRPHPLSKVDTNYMHEYINWIDTTAKFIHALAPHQLVSTGNEGLAGSLQDSVIYIRAHQFESIDYLTFHIWPKNWGWFDAKQPGPALLNTIQNTAVYFKKHRGYAMALNKPIVLEEFGMPRDWELFQPNTAVTNRDDYLKEIFKLIEQDAQAGGAVAGSNYWAWGGEGRPHNKEAAWIKNLDFTGDPPQEPQGLNSIYDSDTSTLRIFKIHNACISKKFNPNTQK